jgi:caffeoyl-CoA O-methyltransferase
VIAMLTLTRPGIEEYALLKTEEHVQLLEDLMKETYDSMDLPQMLTGPIEGQFLKMMVMVTQAKSVLEIGTFTGYATLSMAEGLVEGGKVVTLDINPECLALARKYFAKSEYGKKIEAIEGPALSSLAKLDGPFDLVFIDADKTNYLNYYEAVLPKLRKGGIILVDNVLWSGAVLDPKTEDDLAISTFNDRVADDKRVDKVLLTVRDGVYFIRKR